METVVAPDSQAPVRTEGKKQKKFWKFLIAFLVLIAVGAAVWFVWTSYLDPEAKRAREAEENYEKYIAWEKAYEDAMREDTYGGKTPEETLRMFIDALKKEDIELASKYFMLETNEKSPDYLTRRRWEEALFEANKAGKIPQIVFVIKNQATSTKRDLGSSNVFEFVVYGNDGVVENSISLRLNEFSNVWKIESL